MLPSTVQTEEEALKAFEETQRPDATSFGRTIYYDRNIYRRYLVLQYKYRRITKWNA